MVQEIGVDLVAGLEPGNAAADRLHLPGNVDAEDLFGFVSYGRARDEDADSQRAGEIYAIYPVPAAWDKGTGRQLMAAALGRLAEAGSGQVILWVLDSNARARRFYEAGGWLADGAAKRDDSFGVPVNEVRYCRSLP